jgi:hypothetical protein
MLEYASQPACFDDLHPLKKVAIAKMVDTIKTK